VHARIRPLPLLNDLGRAVGRAVVQLRGGSIHRHLI
jgi:hypothetical protein